MDSGPTDHDENILEDIQHHAKLLLGRLWHVHGKNPLQLRLERRVRRCIVCQVFFGGRIRIRIIFRIAVEYSLSATAISVPAVAVDIGLMAGMTASVMANNVFHCAGVSGSSVGKGGKGVALGEMGSVGRDMLNRQIQGWLR
jgi:hypothetical protein